MDKQPTANRMVPHPISAKPSHQLLIIVPPSDQETQILIEVSSWQGGREISTWQGDGLCPPRGLYWSGRFINNLAAREYQFLDALKGKIGGSIQLSELLKMKVWPELPKRNTMKQFCSRLNKKLRKVNFFIIEYKPETNREGPKDKSMTCRDDWFQFSLLESE